jgi:predicted DNA binding CopG/RHH family protein
MAIELVAPKFRSKSDELAWYDQHWGKLEHDMEKSLKDGTAIKCASAPAANPLLVPVTIRLSKDDLTVARRLAGEVGMRYQTYLRTLLHQALRQKAR